MTETTQPRKPANLPSTLWRIRFPDGSVATLEGEPADYMKPYATAYHIPRQVAPEAPTSLTNDDGWSFRVFEDEDRSWLTLAAPDGREVSWSSFRGNVGAQILQDFAIALASTGAAHEAPTCTGCDPAEGFCRACRDAEQRSIATTTAGAPPTDFTIVDGGRTIVTGLLGSSNRDEPVRIFKEVIPASASSDYYCYNCGGDESAHYAGCPAIRAPAPSRNAAPLDDLWIHEDMHNDATKAILSLPRKELKRYFIQAREDVTLWQRRALTAEAALAQQGAAQAAHAGAASCRNAIINSGARAWPRSCPRCGIAKNCPDGVVVAMSAATEKGEKP